MKVYDQAITDVLEEINNVETILSNLQVRGIGTVTKATMLDTVALIRKRVLTLLSNKKKENHAETKPNKNI